LEQSERSVRIRLKHMEAYCDGLGRNPSLQMPQRTVTERDLRELGQQYNLRDNIERLHEAKINVLRDRQTKRMEELLDRQEAELAKLVGKRQEELEDLAAKLEIETDQLQAQSAARKDKIRYRWELAMEILCKELEASDGLVYAKLPCPDWLKDDASQDDAEAGSTTNPQEE
jgi:DNA-binding Xre family transcriptional regulator